MEEETIERVRNSVFNLQDHMIISSCGNPGGFSILFSADADFR